MAEVISHILGIFLGALLGIPAGVALNHAIQSRVGRSRRRQLRNVLREALKSNESIIEELTHAIEHPGGIPMTNLDLVLLESTASLKYEIIDDLDLCREIDALRYRMARLWRQLEVILKIDFDPTSRSLQMRGRTESFYEVYRPLILEVIRRNLDLLKGPLAELQQKLAE